MNRKSKTMRRFWEKETKVSNKVDRYARVEDPMY